MKKILLSVALGISALCGVAHADTAAVPYDCPTHYKMCVVQLGSSRDDGEITSFNIAGHTDPKVPDTVISPHTVARGLKYVKWEWIPKERKVYVHFQDK